MKIFEHKDVIRKEKVCVGIFCDMCGAKAEDSKSEWSFDYGGYSQGGGSIQLYTEVGRETERETKTLCCDCTEWLMKNLEKLNELRKNE